MSNNIHQYGSGDNIAGDKVTGDKIGTQFNNNLQRANIDNFANEVEQQITTETKEPDNNSKLPIATKPSLWSTGGFFLLAIVVITAMAAIISAYVPWYIIPIVFIFGILGVGVIGAFILRYNGELSEPNFLKLMIETYKRIPLLIQGKSPNPDVGEKHSRKNP